MTEIRINGHVFTGVMRGSGIVDYHFFRFVGTLGFEPFKGTLNVKLDQPVDISLYSTKAIEHVLLDGTKKINALLAPVILIMKREGKEEHYDCWAMRDLSNIYPADIIEIVARDNITEKFSMKDNEEVIVTFFDIGKKSKKDSGFMKTMRRRYGTESHLMKS